MDEINDGGPAFPLPAGTELIKQWQAGYGEYQTRAVVSSAGLSIRDYFAAAALQGMMAAEPWSLEAGISVMAYRHADAMLAARSIRPSTQES